MSNIFMTKAQKRSSSDERILCAAAKVFGSLGYSKATLTAIAEEAEVSQGLVSQRFGSKESLLNAVFDQTRILSFYDNGNRHLPQAFYVLLNQLKREVEEAPEWFRFLSMIHTGRDTPDSFDAHTKATFCQTPLYDAIKEAQALGDLPEGDPWDIFRVFFRNATNLISWYHEFNLPMPENDVFLYAIQYNRREKESQIALKTQLKTIQSLQVDRSILFEAVSEVYPLIIFCNLTQNSFYTLEHEHFTTKRKTADGVYDELINTGASTIPNDIHREQFLRLFSRENAIHTWQSGKHELYLRHMQTGDDGIVRWIETRGLISRCACGDILVIVLARSIDDEMDRLRCYGEALQKAELASETKSRFLSNLSHEIRTPMNAVTGYSELLKRRAYEPTKVNDFAGKINTAANELMDLLSRALDAAKLSHVKAGSISKFNINESSTGIIANATKLARQRNVTISHQIGTLTNYRVYTDEILLQKCVMSLIFIAINETPPGGIIQLKLEEIADDEAEFASYRLTIHDDGIGVSNELFEQVHNDPEDMDGIFLELTQIRESIRTLGGTLKILPQEEGNTAICDFRFRRA